jgi:hypothetical protein
MKRSPSATRSYLRQLAEPVPHPAALLTPRRPAERGASTRSALDAIPPIFDSISDTPARDTAPRLQLPARSSHARGEQTPRSRALPVDASTQPQPTEPDNSWQPASRTSTAARRDKRITSTTLAGDEPLPRPHSTTRESPSSREPLALQENAAPHNEDRKKSFTHTPSATGRIASKASAHAEPNHIARDQSSRGIRVHIGTVEVRTAVPVRESKPAPAIDRNFRSGRSGVAAEPLSRGLAWSHGLVQG